LINYNQKLIWLSVTIPIVIGSSKMFTLLKKSKPLEKATIKDV